jgi:hypothetical protein
MMAARDAGSGPTSGPDHSGATTGAAGGGGERQHPPTATMSGETQGKAASPEDVRRQTQGRPTAAEEAAGTRPAGSVDKTEASAALDRARGFDREGKEAECIDAVQQAKRLSGS